MSAHRKKGDKLVTQRDVTTCASHCNIKHRTLILIPIVTTLFEQVNVNLFSASPRASVFQLFGKHSEVRPGGRRSLSDSATRFWFFTVCRSATDPAFFWVVWAWMGVQGGGGGAGGH